MMVMIMMIMLLVMMVMWVVCDVFYSQLVLSLWHKEASLIKTAITIALMIIRLFLVPNVLFVEAMLKEK